MSYLPIPDKEAGNGARGFLDWASTPVNLGFWLDRKKQG